MAPLQLRVTSPRGSGRPIASFACLLDAKYSPFYKGLLPASETWGGFQAEPIRDAVATCTKQASLLIFTDESPGLTQTLLTPGTIWSGFMHTGQEHGVDTANFHVLLGPIASTSPAAHSLCPIYFDAVFLLLVLFLSSPCHFRLKYLLIIHLMYYVVGSQACPQTIYYLGLLPL